MARCLIRLVCISGKLTARNEPFGRHIKNKLKSINFFTVMTLTIGEM